MAVLVLGIMGDMLDGAPLGLSSALLLLLWWLVVMQRRYLIKEPLWVVWLVYSCVVVVYMLLYSGLVSLLYMIWLWQDTLVMRIGLTIGYYPFVHYVFSRVYHDYLRGFEDNKYD